MRNLATLIFFVLILSGCAAPVTEQPTRTLALSPVATITPDTAAQALANLQAQSTLEAMKATSQVIEINLTGTAFAPTQEFITTSTAQAFTILGWTATASNNQTATASSGTATQQSVNATSTQQVLNNTATVDAAAASAKATALHGEAVSVELAIERERMMNNLWAVTPWAASIMLLTVLAVVAMRWSRVRPIPRDARGDAPLLIVDGIIYDADRNPQPLLDVSGSKPAIPALTDLQLQASTTARDQMIDLASRGTPAQGRREAASKVMEQNIPPSQPPINVLSAEESKPLLLDVLPGIVRDTLDVDILDEGKAHE